MSKLLIPGILQQQVNQQVPVSSWCYEGVMTVGNYTTSLYGYRRTGPPGTSGYFGEINPEITSDYTTCSGFPIPIAIYFATFSNTLVCRNATNVPNCGTIEINGVEYIIPSSGLLVVAANPFPSPGLTCTIKLK